MILIPKQKDYADTNVRLLGLLDQMTRTEQSERMNELQRGLAFRGMGDAKRAAQSFNNAMGRGVSRMNAEDFRVERGANAPGVPRRGLAQTMKAADPSMDEAALSGEFTGLGKQLLAQGDTTDPRLNEAFKQSGLGQGEGLSKELATGYGPKAAKAMERLNKVAVNTADFEAYKERAKQRAGVGPSDIPTEAEEQYGYYFDVLNKARLSGNPGAIRDAKNDLVLKYRMLDNKFGWNMSSGLKDLLAERPSGGGRGVGKDGQLWYNQLTGDVTDKHPGYEADGKTIKKGFVPQTEATFQAMVKRNEEILNDDKNYTPEQRNQARVNLDKFYTGRAKREIITMNRDASSPGLSPLVNYRDTDTDYENMAAGPNNKNKVAAEPKSAPTIKYKEGYEYEVNGQRMVYQNGRLRKL